MLKRLFAIAVVLGAMLVSAPRPVRASIFEPTIVGVAWNKAGAVIYRSKTKENHFGLSYEVGMSSKADGRIEVLFNPTTQTKVMRNDVLIPWSRYLVYRFRVVDEEGNLVDADPRLSLNTPDEAWTQVGNCLVADTSKLDYESFTGSIVAYSDKRTDKRYLLFFRGVDHERVTNALSYSFSVFNGGDRVRRRMAVRGLTDSNSPEYQQAFYAALKKEMESSMPSAEWLSSSLLTAEEEAAIWYQMAQQQIVPPKPTSYRAEISVIPLAGWRGKLELVFIDQSGRELLRGIKGILDLPPGSYTWWLEADGIALERHTKVVGEGENNLTVTVKEGGQR
ncbi:MAG: hypothetical protein AAB881_00030 [Patescibacteria group bacterium]